MKKTTRLVLILASALATNAPAQTGGWLIETDSVVSPSNPTTTVEVWAQWNDPLGELCCFAFGDFDFAAQEGVLSAPTVVIAPSAGWSEPGEVSGNGKAVRGTFVGQGISMYGSFENPILTWSVTWTTTDFTPRTVDVWTENTSTFIVGKPSHTVLQLVEFVPGSFLPGTGAISVVPSPATALPIALLGTLALGRRRTS